MPDDPYIYCEEPSAPDQGLRLSLKPWRILIVDDEPSVHEITQAVFQNFTFEDRRILFVSAYSAKEARYLMEVTPDVALILLDVVMESDDAGLKFAKAVRAELGNTAVRIILRTGQPGKALERSVILEYDINDYREKTELTFQKLFTSVVSSLRSYRDIRTIETQRQKLEGMLRSAPDLFRSRSPESFASETLRQLVRLAEMNAAEGTARALLVTRLPGGYNVVASDEDSPWQGELEDYGFLPPVLQRLEKCFLTRESFREKDCTLNFLQDSGQGARVIYLETPNTMSDFDHHLTELLLRNVQVAFDNLVLTREIEDTQKEIIYTIGEMIERRSLETGFHVKRVSEISRTLALKMGLEETEARVIALAAPMHDVGKLGIPDSILHKTGTLTEEEKLLMQTHPATGYEILKNSGRPILKAAAAIARSHHEKWDGTGYPDGLKGEEIPFHARIVAAADVFDSLLSRRSYKESWDLDTVRDFFSRERGGHFDPRVADTLLDNLKEILELRNSLDA